MSDPYLLAASLLTVGPVSAPPPPPFVPNLFENLSALLASAKTHHSHSVVTQPIISGVELPGVEFSSSSRKRVSPFSSASVSRRQVSAISESALTTNLSPQSGTQLYYQRFAALKAGQTYTRLPADSFQSVWSQATLAKPTHTQWKQLLAEEAKAMARGQGNNRLSILVGDSLSLWFPAQNLPSGQFWLNQGISGENSSQILGRLSAFAQTQPDTIYVMAGTNDLRQGVRDRVILDNIRQIVQRLRQNHPQSQIIVQSILPTRLSAIPSDRIYNLNQQIAAIAQQEGAGYLNLHSLFVDNQGQIQRELTTDGIHLARRGYAVWQEALNYADALILANR